jgi:hypothetical protein
MLRALLLSRIKPISDQNPPTPLDTQTTARDEQGPSAGGIRGPISFGGAILNCRPYIQQSTEPSHPLAQVDNARFTMEVSTATEQGELGIDVSAETSPKRTRKRAQDFFDMTPLLSIEDKI